MSKSLWIIRYGLLILDVTERRHPGPEPAVPIFRRGARMVNRGAQRDDPSGRRGMAAPRGTAVAAYGSAITAGRERREAPAPGRRRDLERAEHAQVRRPGARRGGEPLPGPDRKRSERAAHDPCRAKRPPRAVPGPGPADAACRARRGTVAGRPGPARADRPA